MFISLRPEKLKLSYCRFTFKY